MSSSNSPVRSSKAPGNTSIAVVGVSALFPGSSNGQGFWRDILDGRDLLTEVPPDYWRLDDYYDADPKVPDKTYARRGAFLDKVGFDPLKYGIPPTIIPATDTSQLLALIVAQRVLDDATRGQFASLDKDRVSVILGVTSAQELLGSMVSRLQHPIWVKALREAGLPESKVQEACERLSSHYVDWQESTFPGLLGNVVAGRIANRFDLHGTNCVTDAACASAFSALSMSVNELLLGQSDLVITGGVDTMNDIFMFMCFSKTPALSASGDCRPFSDKADGTMLGEGLGMVALKRLADAERDGDQIYAVIQGVGSSSDGRAKSVYAPVPEGQARALRRAYEVAGYGPETVELVEAHGTGTKAGDAAEFAGLKLAFGESGREDAAWCALGSVKSQIGHTKSAAGSAGLFKTVMALHHKVLPPTIKIDRPNPKMGLEGSPFYLNTTARPWVRPTGGHPRRASVSSFGFGGSNFHITLEEYKGEAKRPTRHRHGLAELVTLSGNTAQELVQTLRGTQVGGENFLEWFARHSQSSTDLKAPARVAIVASSDEELADKLAKAASMIEANPTGRISTPIGIEYAWQPEQGKVAFVFPGQGSQYLNMGAQVAMAWDDALTPWDEAGALAFEGDATPLHDVVFPRTLFFDEEGRQGQAQKLVETQWAQPAIGVTSLSHMALLEKLGLKPDVVGGHSFGEVTALHVAGAFDAKTMVQIARRRGELMRDASEAEGSMTAVSATIEEVRPLVESIGNGLVVANHNAPTQVVISGPTGQVEAAEAALTDKGVRFRRLKVATAFHSSVVAQASGPLGEFLNGVEVQAPGLPVYANALAAPYEADAKAVRQTLAEQVAQPVRFVEQIEAMYAAGVRTFVEVGPGSVLTGLVGKILGDRPHEAINLDRKGADAMETFHRALGRLWVAGLEPALEALWSANELNEDPREAKPPRLSIDINGANYGKPYPPADGVAVRPPPNPEVEPEVIVKEVVKEVIKEIPVKVPGHNQPIAAQPNGQHNAPTNGVATNGVHAHTNGVHASTNGVYAPAHGAYAAQAAPMAPVGGGWAPAAPALPVHDVRMAWIHTYQEVQRQTAETHAMWQTSMSQAHMAYLQAAETSFRSLGAMMNGQPVTPAPALPAPAFAPPAFAPAPPAAAWPAPAPAPYAPPAPVVAQAPAPAPTWSAPEPVMPVAPAPVAPAPAPVVVTPAPAPAPVAPAPAAAPAVGVDLEALLLEVVAEKTGYPAEMLSMEMNLEADLGIDSIKRVEILSAMSEKAPDLPEVDTSEMAALKTLGQIVDYMGDRSLGKPQGAPEKASQPVAAARDPRLGRFVLDAVPTPAPGLAIKDFGHVKTAAIIDDGQGVADALEALLRSRGIEVSRGLEACKTAQAVFFLGGLRPVQSIEEATAIQKDAFDVARAAANHMTEHGGVFVTVQDTGGDFGLTGSERAWMGGITGLTKTAGQEWAKASVKAIDIERAQRTPGALATAILGECLGGGGDLEVGLKADGQRTVLRSTRADVEGGDGVSLEPGAVIVVSGGARGVTASTLKALAASHKPRLLLLGRTPLQDEPEVCKGMTTDAELKRALLMDAKAKGQKITPAKLGSQVRRVLAGREIRDNLAALRAAGAVDVRYLAVDVRDASALDSQFRTVRQQWGPIRGIIHGAGVLADKLIAAKTDDHFDRVFGTKIGGLKALLEATSNDPLALLVLFSSVAARSGNNGQSDYAMANETLNKVGALEARRRGATCLVKSLGWGPWEGGMVTPALKARFEALGVALIPHVVGAQMMVEELIGGASNRIELVLGAEPARRALLAAGEAPQEAFDIIVTAQDHPYLVDHSIRNKPVVPVVLVLEWFARAATAMVPDMELVACSDVKVRKGILLENFHGRGDRFEVHAKQLSNGNGVVLGLELRSDDGRVHYVGKAQMAPKAPEAPVSKASAGSLTDYDGPLYNTTTLFHGPDFQVIRSLAGISNTGIEGELEGARAQSWESHGQWRTDVAAMDGGLQLAVLWTRHMLGGDSLPTGVGSYKTYSTGLLNGAIKCTIQGQTVGRSKMVCDVAFTSPDGRLLAEMNNVETHLLPS